jgi:AP-3 complex subunit beta
MGRGSAVGSGCSAERRKGLCWRGVCFFRADLISLISGQTMIAKLQILTLATKLLVLAPAESQLLIISQYLSTLARYDAEYDVRDRSRFLHALLRGVRVEKDGDVEENGDDEDELGGVVLRREQVRLVMLGKRESADTQAFQGIINTPAIIRNKLIRSKLSRENTTSGPYQQSPTRG